MLRRALYDVNMLIALFDPLHVRHADAHAWHGANGEHGWASCPLTQNVFDAHHVATALLQPVTACDHASSSTRIQRRLRTLIMVRRFVSRSGRSAHAWIFVDVRPADRSLPAGTAIKDEGRLVTLDARIPINAVIDATPAPG